MPRRVEISTCIECPYQCHRKGEKRPFCNALNSYITSEPTVDVDSRCPLEVVDLRKSKDDHRLAIRHIYQILQKKGINEDSLHDANTYFCQYMEENGK